MPFDTVVHKTIEYLAIPAVVGHEQFFLEYLAKDFENLGLEVNHEHGILAISGSDPKARIISAHADRHGLISLGGGKYKYAAQRVRKQKYDEDSHSSEQVLDAISDRFEGEIVLAYDPKTGEKLGEGEITLCDSCMDDGEAIFSIKGMEEMPVDIPVGYARQAESDGEHLKGQIDNVVSLGIIYVLFQNGFQGTALISTEEEIGKSWIHISRWLEAKNIESKELIILDTSPYRETAPVETNMVILRNRDKTASFNAELVDKLKQRATENLTPFQVKDEYFLSLGLEIKDLGSTELGRLVDSCDGRWSGATIQIPTTEYHTSYETTSRGCIESFYAFLHDILVLKPIF